MNRDENKRQKQMTGKKRLGEAFQTEKKVKLGKSFRKQFQIQSKYKK